MSRRTLVRKITDEYASASQILKNELSHVATVATTADVWSCCKRSYLGMTAHYIDPVSLKRKMGALACRRLKGKHKYDVIAKQIEALHDEFGIETKVCSTTIDNASNFVKAFDVLGLKRFTNVLNDENTLLASALHPTIKLGWLADKERAKEVEG